MTKKILKKETIEKAAGVLKVVAHPVRLMIIETLKNHKKLNVSQIVKKIGQSQSVTSQHLKALKLQGVLGSERVANEVFYFVTNKDVLKIIDCISKCN